MTRGSQEGVALVNVLVVLTLTASVVTAMIAGQDHSLLTARQGAAAAQAGALAQSGEASVRAALVTDRNRTVDHLAEPWAHVQQAEITLTIGQFTVTLEDVQGRFDLNRLTGRTVLDFQIYQRITRAIGLPAHDRILILRAVTAHGPFGDLDDLRSFGVTQSILTQLRPHMAVWPHRAQVNLNTATEPVLAALLANPLQAKKLIQLRGQRPLSPGDLLPPPGAGFTSDLYDVHSFAEVDGISRHLTSRLYRDGAEVRVISRRFGAPP